MHNDDARTNTYQIYMFRFFCVALYLSGLSSLVICVSMLCCPLWATCPLPHRFNEQKLNGTESDYYSYHLNLKYIYPRNVQPALSNWPHPTLHIICETHVIYMLWHRVYREGLCAKCSILTSVLALLMKPCSCARWNSHIATHWE
jgi:hypothetical protein